MRDEYEQAGIGVKSAFLQSALTFLIGFVLFYPTPGKSLLHFPFSLFETNPILYEQSEPKRKKAAHTAFQPQRAGKYVWHGQENDVEMAATTQAPYWGQDRQILQHPADGSHF